MTHEEYLERRAADSLGISWEEWTGQPDPDQEIQHHLDLEHGK